MATSGSDEVSIDWAKADAQDGKVKLPLAGRASKRWAEEAASIFERLEPMWPIEVKTKHIVVDGVTPGQESDVRHIIESAVLEANARLAKDSDSDADDGQEPTDEEMARTFRAFGDAPAG